MTLEILTRFFMWCTIINAALLIFWTILLITLPGLIYRMQRIWFPITRETFNLVIYCFLGLYKIIFIIFTVVPYIALLIIGSS